MINVKAIKYQLLAITPDGKKLPLNQVQRELSFSEQPGELAMKLSAEIQNQKVGDKWLHQLLPLGCKIELLADLGAGFKEIFQGKVVHWSYKTDPLGHFSITALDSLYQLRSKDHKFYQKGTKARVIIEDVLNSWGIPVGTIQGLDVELGKKIFRNKSLAAMITETLDEVEKRGGGKFTIRSSEGKVNILSTGKNPTVYHFGADDGVISIDDQQDIEDLITRVKIVGKENKEGYLPIVSVLDGKTEFGLLQDILYREEFDSPAATQKAAEEILKERGKPRKKQTVTTIDLPCVRKGDKVHIQAGTLNDYYLVKGVMHNVSSQSMTMEVEGL